MLSWRFYDARADGAKISLAGRGILIVSDPLIHQETKFSDGMSFSAEFGIGPRIKSILYSHPERWKTINLSWITQEDEEIMRRRAEFWCKLREYGHSKYDTQGAIGCAITGAENPWDPFCSESGYEILVERWKLVCLNHKLHPQKLYEIGKIMEGLWG